MGEKAEATTLGVTAIESNDVKRSRLRGLPERSDAKGKVPKREFLKWNSEVKQGKNKVLDRGGLGNRGGAGTLNATPAPQVGWEYPVG